MERTLFLLFGDLRHPKPKPIVHNFNKIVEVVKQKEIAKNVDGKITGIYFEQKFTSGFYTIYVKSNKTFLKMSFNDGSSSDDEMIKSKVHNGIRLEQKGGNKNGEYFILTKSDSLEFYDNTEKKKFTTATKIK